MRKNNKTGIDWSDPEQVRENRRKNQRRYYQRHKEKIMRYQNDYNKKNREKIRDRSRKYYIKNKEKLINYQRKYKQERRIIILERLGNRCIKCGFDDYRALQIDHIHGGGNKEKKEKFNNDYGKYHKHLLSISEKELFNTYQCLCANCNWIKRFENNEVPHHQKKAYKEGRRQ